jgi:hypothetical protein
MTNLAIAGFSFSVVLIGSANCCWAKMNARLSRIGFNRRFFVDYRSLVDSTLCYCEHAREEEWPIWPAIWFWMLAGAGLALVFFTAFALT